MTQPQPQQQQAPPQHAAPSVIGRPSNEQESKDVQIEVKKTQPRLHWIYLHPYKFMFVTAHLIFLGVWLELQILLNQSEHKMLHESNVYAHVYLLSYVFSLVHYVVVCWIYDSQVAFQASFIRASTQNIMPPVCAFLCVMVCWDTFWFVQCPEWHYELHLTLDTAALLTVVVSWRVCRWFW